jgi:hypothetical protein
MYGQSLTETYLFKERLGVKTRAFHLGDYRRATMPPGQDVPDDYFFVNGMFAFPFKKSLI